MRYRYLVFLVTLSIFVTTLSSASAQEADLKRAEELLNQVISLHQQEKLDEAESIAKEFLSIMEQASKKVMEFYKKGQYEAAIPLAKQLVQLKERAVGPNSPHTATSLHNLALLYKSIGAYDLAEPLYKRALDIYEKALGPEHPDTATSLDHLGLLFMAMGAYDQIEPLFKRALDIREKALGPEHPDTATSLNNLAGLYNEMGTYDQAEPLYKRALAIREKVLGPEHPDTAQSLNNLAGLYKTMGNYDLAEPLYKRALDIREKVLGPEHPDTAQSLNSLASFYHDLGAYDQAEPLYKSALAIRDKNLGPEHPRTATSLNNLAELYRAEGAYDQAEPLYKRALAIKEKALGPEHPDTSVALNNLALLYHDLGAYDQAEPLYKRALAIKEKALGPEHPDTAAISLNNLATLYHDLGAYDQAEPLYKRALAIEEKNLGPEHPDTARSLNNLAALYHDMDAYDQAEPLFKRALAIREKAMGMEHPDTAINLNNLARLYQARGLYSNADPLFKRALNINEKALGPEHPTTAISLNNLALLHAAQSDYKKAHNLFKQAQIISELTINQVFCFTNEKRKLDFMATQQTDFKIALGLVAFHLNDDPGARLDAFNWWLRRKGAVLEAQKRLQEVLIYGDAPEAFKLFQEASKLRSRISQLVFGGPGKMNPHDYQAEIATLKKQINNLEAELAGLSVAFNRGKKVRQADVAQVAQCLPQDSALLEFARIRLYNFQTKVKEKRWQPGHYLAFILPAGKDPQVTLLDLGEAAPIDQAVAGYKKAITDTKDIKGVGSSASARKLHDLVFAKLKPKLGDIKDIFISPDGDLSLIPFEVLQDPDGRYLIEDYTFNYLSAGRDLVGFGQLEGDTGKAVIIGDPDFDLDSEEEGQSQGDPNTRMTRRSLERSRDMRGLYFTRLPGTREEVEAIRTIIGDDQSDLYTDRAAIEDVLFRQKRSPRILHLATHGFFLKDQDMPLLDNTRGLDFTDRKSRGPVIRMDNPLLRSGLALAGANRTMKSDSNYQSDGLLTAEKVLGLRLRGTELVVLSACDTGAGEVKTGEGVYGLRRAFVQAGTKGLVMSLWSVPDRETQELMVQFYKNIQSGKMNRCQALRQAMLKQKEIAQQRYGSDNPLFWGAFVFLGEP